MGTLGKWPYGYYIMLRWVVCGAAIAFVVCGWSLHERWAVLVFAPLAALFNPIVPVHLSRQIWRPIDVVAAVTFVTAAVLVKGRDCNRVSDGTAGEPRTQTAIHGPRESQIPEAVRVGN
jgi:hypothetical protein